MKCIIQCLLIVLMLVYSVNSAAISENILENPAGYFNQDSYKSILQQNKDEDFIMLLWSLDCPPCIAELPMISSFHRRNPDIEIIMVSTDDSSRMKEAENLMQENNLADLDQWVFAADNYQKIRYSIDPQWYGELPRSYFYIAGKRIASISGRLKQADLEKWLTGQRKRQDKVKFQ